ncbi:MAG TPA: hypothetical protein VGQ16_17280 [Vicinamibacterales bacterium]|nr:hypothetical protein [Vicinamibacterales bacterium]
MTRRDRDIVGAIAVFSVFRRRRLAHRLYQIVSSVACRGDLEQRRQPSALSGLQDVHASMHRILGSFEQAGFRQQIERASDLVQVIPDVSGEPVARQQCARVPMEKEDEVQITGVTKDADAAEEVFKAPARHDSPCRLPQKSMLRPPPT